MLACLSHYRSTTHAEDLKQLEAITAVYNAQGMEGVSSGGAAAADGAAAAAADVVAGSDVDEQQSSKRRRSGGSSVSNTERAIDGFARVMTPFLPPPPPGQMSAEKWLQSCMVTARQQALIKAELPESDEAMSCLMLSTFDDEDFDKIELMPKQVKAWKALAAAFKP